jgi:outer membrane receptor for ferrienterochelin and colicins
MRLISLSSSVLLMAFIVLSLPARAASDEPPEEAIPAAESEVPALAAPGTSRTFFPADFARFAPRTALDMLRQVPGFTIRQEAQERGLGQATGNVLINGKRTSGKSNDVITELDRVPAQNVERIEIVDAATLDVPGLSGQVANVIVRSSTIKGQFAVRPEFRAHNTDPLLTRFQTSVSGTAGRMEYTLGLENHSSRSGAAGPTWIYAPDGALVEDRDEHWRGNFDQPRISGKLVFDGPGESIGNLNLSYRRIYYDYRETGTRTSPGAADRHRLVTVDERGDNYEIGGDYELGLGKGALKLIALHRSGHTPSETNLLTTFADDSPDSGSRFTREADESESIGRAEYRWTGGGGEWQISAEGAFNSLDNASKLFVMVADGDFEEIPLPGGSARVEEDRYEVMASYGRPLRSDLTMQLSIGGEYSEIAQIGGGGQTRSFYRPKGVLSTAWNVSPVTDLNVRLARRVGQLNFFSFLASVNLRDDIENAANPDLVPQQSWELDLEGVRQLGSVGTTTLRLYGRLIDDIIDTIPIGESGEAPGNLDSAIVYGIQSSSTFNLDPWGWRGARLNTNLQFQQSRVEDPLTGERRHISNSLLESASVGLRHDIPSSEWAWGGGLSYYRAALNYRLTEVGRLWEGPVWDDLFVEHKNVAGLTVRAAVTNLLGARSMWDRTVYVGRRTGPVAFVEERDRMIGPIFSFSIQGRF